jgi:hypothetical protein
VHEHVALEGRTVRGAVVAAGDGAQVGLLTGVYPHVHRQMALRAHTRAQPSTSGAKSVHLRESGAVTRAWPVPYTPWYKCSLPTCSNIGDLRPRRSPSIVNVREGACCSTHRRWHHRADPGPARLGRWAESPSPRLLPPTCLRCPKRGGRRTEVGEGADTPCGRSLQAHGAFAVAG